MIVQKNHIALVHEGKKPFECAIWAKDLDDLCTEKKLCLVHEVKKPFKYRVRHMYLNGSYYGCSIKMA